MPAKPEIPPIIPLSPQAAMESAVTEATKFTKEKMDEILTKRREFIKEKSEDLRKNLAKSLNLDEKLLDPDATRKILENFKQKELEALQKGELGLTKNHSDILSKALTGYYADKYKKGVPEEVGKNVDKMQKALKEIGEKKEVADKMGLKGVFEKLTMFLQLFKALGDAMKSKDFTTLEEVVANLTAQPPKNPAKEMEKSRDAYKKAMGKEALANIKEEDKTVDKLLTAYLNPRGKEADALFPGEGRYRMEAQTAIKDHLVIGLELNSITDIKKLESGITEITAYGSDGKKIAIELLIKPDKTTATVIDYASRPKMTSEGKPTGETEWVKKAEGLKGEVKTVENLQGLITGNVTERDRIAAAKRKAAEEARIAAAKKKGGKKKT